MKSRTGTSITISAKLNGYNGKIRIISIFFRGLTILIETLCSSLCFFVLRDFTTLFALSFGFSEVNKFHFFGFEK